MKMETSLCTSVFSYCCGGKFIFKYMCVFPSLICLNNFVCIFRMSETNSGVVKFGVV